MNKIKIMTDSCSDLGKDIRDKYGIGYFFMKTVYKGDEKNASLDWDLYTPQHLYDTMKTDKKNRITTAQVPATEFMEVFRSLLSEGYDVIYIGCSSALSGSVNTANVVAGTFLEEFPNQHIYVIDSLNACLGEGLLAVRAAEYLEKGMTASEVVAQIENDKFHVRQFATINTLDYIAKAGRVSASKAFFGNLMGVKPILISDRQGRNVAAKKAKGRLNSIHMIVSLLKEAMDDPENETVYLAHADCQADAEKTVELIKSEIGCKDVYVNYMGPIIGATCGPDTIGIFAFGKEKDQ